MRQTWVVRLLKNQEFVPAASPATVHLEPETGQPDQQPDQAADEQPRRQEILPNRTTSAVGSQGRAPASDGRQIAKIYGSRESTPSMPIVAASGKSSGGRSRRTSSSLPTGV